MKLIKRMKMIMTSLICQPVLDSMKAPVSMIQYVFQATNSNYTCQPVLSKAQLPRSIKMIATQLPQINIIRKEEINSLNRLWKNQRWANIQQFLMIKKLLIKKAQLKVAKINFCYHSNGEKCFKEETVQHLLQ